MIERSLLLDAVPQMAGRHIVVVGDLFLDTYVIGKAVRLSREAPLPVLEHQEQRQLPGGGANPAMNIVALGGRVSQVGVVGDDQEGQTLTARLDAAGINIEGVVVDPDRLTTTKTRIVAQGSLRFPQQIARVDRVDRRELFGEIEDQVVAHIGDLGEKADAILVSDYRCGLMTPRVVAAVRRSQKRGRLTCVDSQGRLDRFARFDLMKCNHHEAQAYLSRKHQRETVLKTNGDVATAAQLLRNELEIGALLITRGPEGLSLQSSSGVFHIPAANRSEVFDVTGAGDTVIAVATLTLVAGHDALVAAILANYAAGLVVRKLGVATPSPAELAWAIEHW